MNLFFWQPWLIPILPLAGALINGLFGKRFTKSLVAVHRALLYRSIVRCRLRARLHAGALRR